ncbi:MAG: hypothetical protein WC343_09220 [Bacilli bacterium]|jgi:hypothetical protein
MPLQDITIYHYDKGTKKWVRYDVEASFRNTSIRNRNRIGVSDTDNALIRVFDIDGYDDTWKCIKGDVIVNKAVTDSIIDAPLTELRAKYGTDNVYQVQSLDIFDLGESLDHVKIGAK